MIKDLKKFYKRTKNNKIDRFGTYNLGYNTAIDDVINYINDLEYDSTLYDSIEYDKLMHNMDDFENNLKNTLEITKKLIKLYKKAY